MVFGSRRRKKKEQNQVPATKSSDTLFTRNDPHDSTGSISTDATFHYSKKYCNETENSAMAMFARMSTAIADNLTEQEFGTQVNRFYRPKADYTSQIIHPVECKRDIFVHSVTPVKKGIRKPKASSIYKVKAGQKTPYNMSHEIHDDDCSIVRKIAQVEKISKSPRVVASTEVPSAEKEASNRNEDSGLSNAEVDNPELDLVMRTTSSGETHDLSHLSYSSSEDGEEEEDKENISHEKRPGTTDVDIAAPVAVPARPKIAALSVDTYNNTTTPDHLSTHASKYRLAGKHLKVRPLEPSNQRSPKRVSAGVKALESRPISGSQPFRPMSNLRIETGRESFSDVNPHRRGGVTPSEPQLHDTIRFSTMTNPRSSAMEVSPSSTVSSLTIPAELEYNPTPREIFHLSMKSAPMVAINEDDHVITTHDYISVQEGVDLSEI